LVTGMILASTSKYLANFLHNQLDSMRQKLKSNLCIGTHQNIRFQSVLA